MKRISAVVLLLLLVATSVRIGGLRASESESAYTEGVNLYQQGQYVAAQRHLQGYEDDFYYVACAFELRQPLAQKQLKAYLSSHPYTPYASEVHYMLGVLRVESGKWRSARKELSKAVKSELFRPHQEALSFYAGYAHLQMRDLRAAAREFESIKNGTSPYAQQATYYYGYCEYAIGNYGKALPALLQVEGTKKFGDIVPYYLVQIYYQQGQYDEVLRRMDRLPEDAELHRIMGEIYYQKQEYDSCIRHLRAYVQSPVIGSPVLREDVYLLGISEYKVGQYGDAVQTLKGVKMLNDTLTQSTQLHLGHCYRALGQLEQAKMSYGAAMRFVGTGSSGVTSRATREEAMYNYALTSYETRSALGESLNAFTTFLKEYPESKHKTEAYALLSSVFLHSKDYRQALTSLNAIENPTAEMLETKQYLRYQLGADAFLNGRYADATRWSDEVITNSTMPSLADRRDAATYLREAWFLKAESAYRQGDYAGAEQAVTTFLSQPTVGQSDNKEMAQYLLGYALFQQKKYPAASAAFKAYVARANKEQATYTDALNRLGDCAFATRDFLGAESWYGKVSETNATGADYALFQRGYTLGLLGRYSDKINQMEVLVRRYPKSDYAADALYEVARAELQRENTSAAIDAYDRLLKGYANSSWSRKAALEKAMLYYNDRQYDNAIAAYKTVVSSYPGSDEAKAALEGIETCYVETNRVAEYLAYTKTLKGGSVTAQNEDSLTFAAANRQYELGHYDQAKPAYILLANVQGSPYAEVSALRAAEITYDEQDYSTALQYFRRLQEVSSSSKNTNIARLGMLRCAYFLGDNATTIEIASLLLGDGAADESVQEEARYNRAKAYLAQQQYAEAVADLQVLSEDVRTAHGSEAKYLLAQALFDRGDVDAAEAEVMAFAGMNTSHQYWLARAFVLLADIYIQRGDDFQAEQYLLSLQQNYRVEDDIQTLCAQRMEGIAAREAASAPAEERPVQPEENIEEDEDDDE